MPKKKTKEDPEHQHAQFKRLAQEIGSDDGKEDDNVMRRLAGQKRQQGAERGGKRS